MHAFSYMWSLPVTRQRWRSHHSIRHARKPHAACKHHNSVFYNTGVIADRSLTYREWEFSTFLAPVTLTLTRWPSCTNSNKYELPTSRLSQIIVWQTDIETYIQTYRQTDRTRIIYTTALRGWSVRVTEYLKSLAVSISWLQLTLLCVSSWQVVLTAGCTHSFLDKLKRYRKEKKIKITDLHMPRRMFYHVKVTLNCRLWVNKDE